MFSLPNIIQMNEQKHKEWQETQKLKRVECNDCGKELARSKAVKFEYFDIYSDTPNIEFYCQECYEKFDNYRDESYFYCDECERYFMTNITWELHYSFDKETGEVLCLNCATRKFFSNPENFLTSAEQIDELTFEDLRKSKHLFGVDNQNMHEEIEKQGWKEVDTVCADSMTGGKVIGFSDCTSQDDTLQEVKENLKTALKEYRELVIVIDGAYQFAVDLTVYGR